MKYYPAYLLQVILERAKRERASEVRFISGMCPALVDKSGPHFVEVAYLTQEIVRYIHQECLRLAGESELISRTAASYAVVVPAFGRYLCNYRIDDNIASLTLLLDADASAMIDAVHPIKRPSLKAEARPEESAPPNKGGIDG